MRGICAALALGLLFAGLGGCAAEDVSPKARVRAFFDEVERASSEKDLKALKAIVSERYKDAAGRDKRDLTGMMTGYYLRQGTIHLLLHVRELDFPEPGAAQAEVLAAMARTPVLDWDELPRIRADAYVFELALAEEDGDWRVVDAAWRPATADDLRL